MMKRLVCISCGQPITKVSHSDPYICRACEQEPAGAEERYSWLDQASR